MGPISSTARAPVTPPAAAKRPRDTQPARTTQAPATQAAKAGGAIRSGVRAASRYPEGSRAGVAAASLPTGSPSCAKGAGHATTPARSRTTCWG
jgi:hypothetical protein